MTKGVFITGTDTDVGKTVVSGAILSLLREKGLNAGYFKVALSGAPSIHGVLVPEDAAWVCKVSNLEEPAKNLVPYVFENAVSPHLASKLEGKPIDINVIKSALKKLCDKYDYIVVEGCGGVACPLVDYDTDPMPYLIADFIKDTHMPAIIVSKSSLGTINHSTTTHSFAKAYGIEIAGFIFNEYADSILCNDNIRMVVKMTGSHSLGKLPTLDISDIEKNKAIYRQSMDLDKIINSMDVIRID